MWEWEFSWPREWFQWEKEVISRFQRDLMRVAFNSSFMDSWKWLHHQSGSFTVKSTYITICSYDYNTSQDEPFGEICALKIPPKGQMLLGEIF